MKTACFLTRTLTALAFLPLLAHAEMVPQVAFGTLEGGTWKTTIILVNRSLAAGGNVQFAFFDQQGNPRPTPANGVTAPTHLINLPPGGSARVVVENDSAPLSAGWLRMTPPAQVVLSGQAILRQKVAGRPDFETVVPFAGAPDAVQCLVPFNPAATAATMLYPFDNTGEFVSSIALANYGASDLSVTVDAVDEGGTSLMSVQVQLRKGNHTAFRLDLQYPILAGRKGVLRVTAPKYSLGIQAFLFNHGGAFTTLLPIQM
ncbi:MAG: hypothetical protein C0504_03595 [Candidatus Solibacter sp.]|nr:hypothetical protein [Candidatus Solibacter sp.]